MILLVCSFTLDTQCIQIVAKDLFGVRDIWCATDFCLPGGIVGKLGGIYVFNLHPTQFDIDSKRSSDAVFGRLQRKQALYSVRLLFFHISNDFWILVCSLLSKRLVRVSLAAPRKPPAPYCEIGGAVVDKARKKFFFIFFIVNCLFLYRSMASIPRCHFNREWEELKCQLVVRVTLSERLRLKIDYPPYP